jgi:glycerol uptake facilitator-like aquaporin
MFEKKANGWIKEKKPLVAAPGSGKGRGKFNVPIFSWGMNVFQVFQTCKTIFKGYINPQICLFQIFR